MLYIRPCLAAALVFWTRGSPTMELAQQDSYLVWDACVPREGPSASKSPVSCQGWSCATSLPCRQLTALPQAWGSRSMSDLGGLLPDCWPLQQS